MSMSKKIMIGAGVLLLGCAVLLLRRHPAEAVHPESVSPGTIPVESLTGVQPDMAEQQKSAVEETLVPAHPSSLDQTMAVILKSTDYNQRIQATLQDTPATVNPQNYAALKTYLLTPQDGKDGDFRQHEYALRNRMMDMLRSDTNRLSETISAFVSVYEMPRQGDVMRGYALQHLASVFMDHSQTLPDVDKQSILSAFTAALDDTSGGTIAGTALVGLHEAARADSKTVSGGEVEAAAMKLIQSPESGTLSKIAAFQICGERKVSGAAQAARQAAFNSSADWVLRMSAVYALRQLGQTAGLETLLNDSDKNVSRAARMALNAQR
jgi:hypothetical protein